MSNVPYIFADDTGNIPLSQLDANFANAKSAADYVIANTQANITQVGVLTSLSVVGNINGSGATFYTGNGRLLTGVQATTIGVVEELSVIGNITSGNVSAFGNVRSGNINVTGQVSAAGNITGQFIKGNGSQLTGILTSYNANLLTGNTLSSNVINSSLTSVGVLANLSVTGNTTVADLYSNDLYTDYVQANSVQTIDVFTDYVLANIRVDVDGLISATGNITGDRYFGNGQALTGIIATSVGTLPSLSVTGNIQSGNLVTNGNLIMGGRIGVVGNVSAVGNIIGNYILGNGAFLTGVTGGTSDAASLTGNTLSPNVTQSSLTTVGTLSTVSVTGNINTSGAIRNPNQFDIQTTANNANIALIPNGTGIVEVTSNLIVDGTLSGASTISAVGNITTSGFFVGNFQGNIVGTLTNIPGPGGAVVYNDGAGNAAATAGLVFDDSGPNVLTVLGDVVSDGVTANVITGGLATANQPNITGLGTLTTLSVTGNIDTTANISGGFILGNGSQLTGLPATYGNANVSTFMAAFGSNTITTTGNIQGGFILGNGALLTGISGGVSSYSNANVVSLMAAFGSNVISTTGNVTANTFIGNIVGAGAGVPNISSSSNLVLSAAQQVQVNGVMTASSTISAVGNISGNYFIGNGSALTGITVATTYSNANVAAFMGAFGSNAISSTGNITTTANVTANNVTANNFVGGGAGTPTLSSATNLDLSAATAVRVIGGGTFKLPNLSSAQIANLIASNGDLVYNTTANKIQGFENGAWGNLI